MTDSSPQAKPAAAEVSRISASGTPLHKGGGAPARPPLASDNAAPVLTNLTPPFSIRMAQFFWILSFLAGAFAVVYSFIIRQHQLPLIKDAVRAVDPARSEDTYTIAADIIYWSVFALVVAVLLVQITLLVSFMGRRPNIRWWQLLTLVIQVLVLLLAMDLAMTGERAQPLRLVIAAQCVLVAIALLWSVLPKGLAWSARKHDVVRHQQRDASVTP